MKRTTRWVAAAVLLLAPLAGLTYAHPEWPTNLGLDLWQAPVLHAELERGEHEALQLEHQVRATLDRIDRKTLIARDVTTGRIDLVRAAREFRVLNAANPTFLRTMRIRYPVGSDDEMHVRNVIATIASLPELYRSAELYLPRYQAELELLRRDGRGRVCLGD